MVGGIFGSVYNDRKAAESAASAHVAKKRVKTKKAPKKYVDPMRNEKCTECKKSLAKGYTIVTLKHKHNIRGDAVKGNSESYNSGELELKTCGELKCMVGVLIKQEQESYKELLETARSELEEERTMKEEE